MLPLRNPTIPPSAACPVFSLQKVTDEPVFLSTGRVRARTNAIHLFSLVYLIYVCIDSYDYFPDFWNLAGTDIVTLGNAAETRKRGS